MSAQLKIRLTPEEYLAIERKAEYKSEYYAGEMFAMAGASEPHNLIAGNTFATLHAQLRKRPCKVYPSDMRVKVSPTGLYTYPDVTVVCGKAQFDDEEKDTLLNPTVIIEVLSPSTEGYDRGRKFEHYRKLESLQEYVLIAQDTYHVEHYTRQPDNQWLLSEIEGLQGTLHLPSINCDLPLADLYDKVEIVSE
jgi:Uma2 family endonuclease